MTPTTPVAPNVAQMAPEMLMQQPRNRFINWLPRVEIRRNFNVTQQMVDSVREIAPQVPDEIIRQDLAITGSVNMTVANIFEGRVQIPEPADIPEGAPVVPQDSAVRRSLSMSSDVEVDDVHSLSEEILRLESSLVDIPSGYGSSASERQKRLETRKKALQQQSRLRYLKKLQERKEKEKEQERNEPKEIKLEKEQEKEQEYNEPKKIILQKDAPISPDSETTTLVPFSSGDPVEIRRRRALEAAERRRKNNVDIHK
eukprot:CAMPEP_0117075926 /NCGR_PEP_ID=MMETSP0472-20121206/53534_1 /TAXON_ID=693140 ORGANISM="Tiarina fusus, Strain LIS" /NCGR_SAMPLE_ID=MMETSP0472 /ASSEMBLY_ACC=CAM_ASM_000603 /LENGTH=256 /DNA_ID=CAMNT_0004801639 /DNA_START=728 /DNA_END=1496 /DNA_ORIENTATION=-